MRGAYLIVSPRGRRLIVLTNWAIRSIAARESTDKDIIAVNNRISRLELGQTLLSQPLIFCYIDQARASLASRHESRLITLLCNLTLPRRRDHLSPAVRSDHARRR